MPKVNDKVMQFVERELKKNPKASTTELYGKAKKVSRSVSKLSIRQFHAKYPLQVKRKLAAKKPRKPRAKAKQQPTGTDANREAIRQVLLGFAKDVAAAEGQAETIEIMANLDCYVDKVAKATS